MPGRQAKLITPAMLRKMLAHVRHRPTARRDRLIILLSVKAGLRAGEIAGLDWPMLLDPQGRVGHLLAVHDRIAKMGSGRCIPMHPHLRRAALPSCADDDVQRLVKDIFAKELKANPMLAIGLAATRISRNSGWRPFAIVARATSSTNAP